MPTYKSFYDILGVDKSASPDELRKAYREKALKTHPDRLGIHSSAAERRAAEAHFHLIHNAYETLRDPHRRRAYDAWGNKADPQVSREELVKRRAERDAWARKLAEGYERRRNTVIPPRFVPTPNPPTAKQPASNKQSPPSTLPETGSEPSPSTSQAAIPSSRTRSKSSPIISQVADGPLADEEEKMIAEMLQGIRARLPPEYEERRKRALQKKAEREAADMRSRTVPV